jgi:hypothetical protein
LHHKEKGRCRQDEAKGSPEKFTRDFARKLSKGMTGSVRADAASNTKAQKGDQNEREAQAPVWSAG